MKLLLAFLLTGIVGYAQTVYGGFITYPVVMQQYQGGELPNYYWVGVYNNTENPTDVVVTVNCPSESQTVVLPYMSKYKMNYPKVLTFGKREAGCVMEVRYYAPVQVIIVKGQE